MANQMIALQARNPQLPDPSRAAAQYANMMNMASQQRASQLQSERIRQEMEYARAGEARAAETQVLDIRGKQLDNEDKELAQLYKMGAAILETEDPTAREAAYQDLVGLIETTSPQLGATMRQVASTFNPNVLQAAMMETEQYFNKKYATPIDSLEIREDGTPVSVQVGGLNPEQRPIFDAPETPMAAPRATPTAPQAAPPSGPIPTGKFGETRVIRPESIPLTPDQQDHIRRMQEGLGMTNTPASFSPGASAGQMSPDMVPAILDSAINTGVMAQIDLDQMLALAPPQARQGIMDVIRDNKIALQADAPSLAASAMSQQQPMAPNPVGRPQSQFAVMRGQAPQATLADLGGQPEMRNVMAQTQPRTISKLRLRDPNVSPTPGIYGVPTGQVAATSQAQRPSKQEVFDTELAKIEAQRKAGPPPSTPQQKRARKTEVANAYTKTQTLVDRAYDPKEGIVSLARKIKSLSPDQKEAITGLSGYIPSFRGSTKEADTLIGNLKGIVTALGKDTAAASGNIGPMAAQEWKTVADMIADLKLEGMTPRALDAQMDRIIRQVDLATNLAQRVYDIQFSDDIKEYPEFRVRGNPSARTKTPVVKGGSRISPDIDKILKSRGI